MANRDPQYSSVASSGLTEDSQHELRVRIESLYNCVINIANVRIDDVNIDTKRRSITIKGHTEYLFPLYKDLKKLENIVVNMFEDTLQVRSTSSLVYIACSNRKHFEIIEEIPEII